MNIPQRVSRAAEVFERVVCPKQAQLPVAEFPAIVEMGYDLSVLEGSLHR